MKTLNEIGNYLSDKAVANKQGIKGFEEKIGEIDEEMKQADADLLNAEDEVNADKYNKAKDAIWTAKHSKELYVKKKEKLANAPAITKVEYSGLLMEVTQSANAAHEEQFTRAAALITELKNIADESSQTSQQANQLMHTLQYDLYKDADALVAASGVKVTQEKKYRNEQAVHIFYDRKVQGTALAKRAGENMKPTAVKQSWLY